MEISISLELETKNGIPYDSTHNLYSVNNKHFTIDVYNFLNKNLKLKGQFNGNAIVKEQIRKFFKTKTTQEGGFLIKIIMQ